MCLLALAAAFLLVEFAAFRTSLTKVELPVSAIVLSVGIFIWSVNNPDWAGLSKAGECLADKVYLVHYGFIQILTAFLPSAGALLVTVLVAVLSFSASFVWDWVAKSRISRRRWE